MKTTSQHYQERHDPRRRWLTEKTGSRPRGRDAGKTQQQKSIIAFLLSEDRQRLVFFVPRDAVDLKINGFPGLTMHQV